MRPHYLINYRYRFVPLDTARKERLKDAIYRRTGRLFRWSPNYREWRRNQALYRKLAEPDADGEHDFREDQFMRDLADCLGMAEEEYADLVVELELVEETEERKERLRQSFTDLRAVPPPIPDDAR